MDVADSGSIFIEQGSNINSYTRIESMNCVHIGKKVLIGPNVYISDRSHSYKDVTIPVMEQGYFSRGKVNIGSGTWLGIHAAVIGNVHIGENCVIGANCVVTKDIPSYSVVVGNPGKIIKRYNIKTNKWEKVN